MESSDNGDQPRVYGGIFKYNRPIKLMCQLWGEFIEIYVKTDLWSFEKVPSGDKGKAAQRNFWQTQNGAN